MQSFYITGGALLPGAPSYVERPADSRLLELTAQGQLCYILTTRQMGKSSLTVHTASSLKQRGIYPVTIDLSGIGKDVTVNQWYLSLLDGLQTRLPIKTDAEDWWEEHSDLGQVRCFTKFIEEVIPNEVDGPVVIFIDEIDFVLNLDFTDDFFAAIRSIHNARALSADSSLPTFVLIGVTTPGELIRDPKRTPFNVGERIELNDFTFEEAKPLAQGLDEDLSKAYLILEWIFEWTGGHPYLTQRLCKAVVEESRQDWSKHHIATLVRETFLGEKIDSDSNLHFVREMLTKLAPDREAVLRTYQDICSRWRDVYDDEHSVVKSHLKLSGIVVREGQVLRVRNPIYEKAFDQRWIRENLSSTWWSTLPRAVKIAAISILLLLVAFIVATVFALFNLQRVQERTNQALSGRLMTDSTSFLDTQYDLALLLGLEAHNTLPTPETEALLRNELIYNPYLSTYLRGHDDLVNVVSFSPDGQFLAAGEADGQIVVWDMLSREKELLLIGHDYPVQSLAYSRDGSLLASGSCADYLEDKFRCNQGEIAIWDLESQKEKENRLIGHAELVRGLAFSPDDRLLASAGDSNLIFWDTGDFEQVWRIEREANDLIHSLAFSPIDENLLVFGTQSGNIGIVDLEARGIAQEIKGHDDRVTNVEFSPDGQFLASSSSDGTIALWDVATWKQWGITLNAHTEEVTDLEFVAEDLLVSTGRDSQILLWNLAGESDIDVATIGRGADINSITFSNDSGKRTLASSGPNNAIILWDLDGDPTRGKWLTGHLDSVLGLAYNADGSVLASASADQSVLLWDVENGVPAGPPLRGHTDAVRRVAFQPQGDYLATAGRDNKVVLWNISQEEIDSRELEGHTAIVRDVTFSPQGDLLASSDDSGRIIVWDVSTGEKLSESLKGHNREVFGIDFSPNGKLLASGGWDGNVQFWDVDTFQPLGEPIATRVEEIWDVEFSPDGKLLAVVGSGDEVIIIDVASNAIEGEILTNQVRNINTVAFSPDGTMLASGGSDSTIVISNVLDRESVVVPLPIHSDAVYSLVFSPDGSSLASADLAGKIFLSVVDYENLTEMVCDIVSRSLTEEEWNQYIGTGRPYRETCLNSP